MGVVGVLMTGPLGVTLLVLGITLAVGSMLAGRLVMSRFRAEIGSYGALPDLTSGADIAGEIERTQLARDEALRRDSVRKDYERAQTLAANARERSQAAESEANAEGERLRELLDPLPLAPIYREAPDDALIRDLEAMRGEILSARNLQSNRTEVAVRVGRFRDHVEQLREALVMDLPMDPVAAVLAARKDLERARELERAAQGATAEVLALRKEFNEKRADLVQAEARIERLDVKLEALDFEGGDAVRGLERLMKARDLRNEASRRRNDLDRETADWHARVREAERLQAEGEIVELSEEQRAALDLRAELLREAGRDLATESGRLGVERNNLLTAPGPAHLAGEIQAAEEELELVLHEHDRIALLRQLIRVADQQYRDRYQAPLLESGAAHLKRFTRSRYEWLTVDDAGGSAPQLEVRRRGQEFPEPVATPLSRGTIQQVYFALRLAMVDQVEGPEPLPIFLDEMFVSWDPERTAGGLDVLARMPRERQIFLFTADPFWAERAEEHVGAFVVRTPSKSVAAGWAQTLSQSTKLIGSTAVR